MRANPLTPASASRGNPHTKFPRDLILRPNGSLELQLVVMDDLV